MLGWAEEFAKETSRVLEKWLETRAATEEHLFSRLYYPIPKTDPPKFNTDYDALADRDLPAIQERYLGKASWMVYAVLSDINGYTPTHNQRYSQPLTGNNAVDLVNNRGKRIFLNRVVFAAVRNEGRYLLQRNDRDNGERAFEISAPVRVKGKRWGAVRLGFRAAEK